MVKQRGYAQKIRNAGNRRPKKILLVSVEGNRSNKTERIYLSHLKNDRVNVRFVPGNETDPETMMRRLQEAVTDYELGKQDLAICLVDADYDPVRDQALEAADAMLRQEKNIKLIVSAPSFEIWYLCHFCCSTRQWQNSHEFLDGLRRYIPGYEKAKDIYDVLQGKEETAIKNARKLDDYCKINGRRHHHVEYMPATDMYEVIEWIRDE